MFCRSHPFKVAKSDCCYCHDPLCPTCQELYGERTFCGKSCYIKNLLSECLAYFLVFLKPKQLYASSLIIVLVVVLVGIPNRSQPTWKRPIELVENNESLQLLANKIKPGPHIKHNLFESSELLIEKTFNNIKLPNRIKAKELPSFRKSLLKKETPKKRFSNRSEIRAPIPIIKSRIKINDVSNRPC